jgi:hypothetical protein
MALHSAAFFIFKLLYNASDFEMNAIDGVVNVSLPSLFLSLSNFLWWLTDLMTLTSFCFGGPE